MTDSGKWRERALVVVIGFAGLIATALVAQPFANHMRNLAQHMRSGTWATTGGKASFEEALQVQFSDPNIWLVSYPSGGFRTLALDNSNRAATIDFLGKVLPQNDELLSSRPEMMSEEYGALLNDIAATGLRVNGYREARQSYDGFVDDLDNEFPSLPITTTPQFESMETWSAQATLLPQSSKCLGEVRRLSPQAEDGAPAHISIHPRILFVRLGRAWFNDAIVRQASTQTDSRLTKYFANDGSLSAVPHSLAVSMPEVTTIKATTRQSKSVIQTYLDSQDCCELQCDDVSLTLVPGSARRAGDVYLGTLNGRAPYVYAVISERFVR